MLCRKCNTRIEDGGTVCLNCGGKSAAVGRSASRGARTKLPLSPSRAQEAVVELDEELPPAARSGEASGRGASASGEASAPVPDQGFTIEPPAVRELVAEQPELLEPGLCAYSDDTGRRVGVGFETEVGVIDLLARDESGAFVVVMVPASAPGRDLVSSMLERIGWVRKHLGKEHQEVRGILLIESLGSELRYAAAAITGTVSFKTYRVAVSFDALEV